MSAGMELTPVDAKLCDQRYSEQKSRMDRQDSRIDVIFETIDELKSSLAYRLPLWAVMLISTLTAIIGWLLKGKV